MKILSLDLTNFRGFTNRHFEFSHNFTVLSGDNGSGKTSVLEALCVALGGWLYAFDALNSVDKRNLNKSDIRTTIGKVNSAPLPQVPVRVACTAEINGENIDWSREILSRGGRTTHGNLWKIRSIATDYNEKIFDGRDEEITLPLVVYYSAARLWNEPLQREKRVIKEKVRLFGYDKAIAFSNSIKDTMHDIDRIAHLAYFEQDEMSLLEMGAIIDAIKLIIHNVMPNAQIKYDTKLAEFCVIDENGSITLYSKLSDGYRCMISLIVDICRRIISLNPQMGADAIKITPGVVLIDELDLHLHPKWQKGVVSDLKNIFPNLQFIATTHSPFIIQSLDPGELVILSNEASSLEYTGESLEDIAEHVMGVPNPQYSKEKEEMYESALQFYQALDSVANKEDIQSLEERLKLLTAKYSGDVAYYAFLQQKLIEKKGSLG